MSVADFTYLEVTAVGKVWLVEVCKFKLVLLLLFCHLT